MTDEPTVRCAQCWKPKPVSLFKGKRGKQVQTCAPCRDAYRGWNSKSATEKLAARADRAPFPDDGRVRVSFTLVSGNTKLGPIPASMTTRNTCPPACSVREAGCYALYGRIGHHWRRTSATGLPWDAFLEQVRALPAGTLWRHNTAGDLPAAGNRIDPLMLRALVRANEGRRGFTFTHKPVLARAGDSRLELRENRAAIQAAVAGGLAINLSAESPEEADALADLGIAPVATMLPHTARATGNHTPAGRAIVVCPAETHALTCADCQLCAAPDRKSVVGFRAHGQSKRLVTQLVLAARTEG